MVKINYVIATYNGKCNRSMKSIPSPKDILKKHLEKVLSLQTKYITQITIMQAESENFYEGYYDIQDIIDKSSIPIKTIPCENYGYSCGQWMKCYEIYKNEFDYYIFLEDDYCGNFDNFDELLVNTYNEKFESSCGGIGLLAGHIIKIKGIPDHWSGSLIISSKTMEYLYSQYESLSIGYTPREYLDLINNNTLKKYGIRGSVNNIRKGYIGGYYQVGFSVLFTIAGIKQEAYVGHGYKDYKLQIPYWNDDNKKTCGGEVFLSVNNLHKIANNKHELRKYNFNQKDIDFSPIVPVQIAFPEYIKNII